jgi:hypothetical protein
MGKAMADRVQKLIDTARTEWQAWGGATWNLATNGKRHGQTDDDPDRAQYIREKYCAPCGDSPTLAEIADDDYFWSAVGLSYIFREAGFKRNEFPFSARHSTWIRAFIKARRSGKPALYWGYRLNSPQATPDVGDLIAYARGGIGFERAQKYFDRTTDYQSHSDLIVARRRNEIDVIGANVMDSIAMKTVRLDSNGFIADRSFNWFAVLKRQF